MEKIVCFNRDREGECLAYNESCCSEHCQARIPTIEGKIALIRALIPNSNARKDRLKLEKELDDALSYQRAKRDGKFEDWMSCYQEDKHRGSGGGSSEGDSNRSTSMKALMKDNRSVDVKPSRAQLAQYKEELQKWENENEKLERLGRTGMSHSKIDSYTQIPICFVDDGVGTCKGITTGANRHLEKYCKECPHINERQLKGEKP